MTTGLRPFEKVVVGAIGTILGFALSTLVARPALRVAQAVERLLGE